MYFCFVWASQLKPQQNLQLHFSSESTDNSFSIGNYKQQSVEFQNHTVYVDEKMVIKSTSEKCNITV
jgi:hypothetical protein